MTRSHDPRARRWLAFPSLMTGEQVDAAHGAAGRHEQQHDPDRRKEKPDPWPILERAFPRIAAKIRKHWGKRALDNYLAKLVVGDRARRRGFPLEVLAAILEIVRLHGERYRFRRPICPWEEDVRESKWWDRR
ncbi:MAG: hypothetical protein ACREVP_06020 [Burkholderiales bacterium]